MTLKEIKDILHTAPGVLVQPSLPTEDYCCFAVQGQYCKIVPILNNWVLYYKDMIVGFTNVELPKKQNLGIGLYFYWRDNLCCLLIVKKI